MSTAAYFKEYRAKNRERILARDRAYFAKNRGTILSKNRIWAQEHPDLMKQYKEVWYGRNYEEIQIRNKKWAEENPERVREIKSQYKKRHPVETRLGCQARRAKTRGGLVVKEQIRNWQSRLCGICEELIEDKFHIDHITPLSLGGPHSTENLQLTHPVCNMRKGNRER